MVIDVLFRGPWVTREPSCILESLALQGYSEALLQIFSRYANDTDEANEYLRSVTLRALRFLPEVGNEHWEIITKYALQGTLVERLMATETWLFHSDSPGFRLQVKHIREIESVKGDPSLPARLWKNYLLLIGRYDSNRVSKVGLADHLTLHQAYQVGHSGEGSELLSYVEPNLIRQNYYSGKQTDDVDYDYQS